MPNKKIEIFSDLDGTFYSIDNLMTSQIDQSVETFLLSHSSMKKAELKNLESRYPNVLDALNILDISKEKFYKNIYSNLQYEKCILPDFNLIDVLKNSDFHITIVSLSPKKHIEKILGNMQLLPFIRDIYSLEYENNTSKELIYNRIIVKNKLSAKDVWIVGDNYKIDIAPAFKLGCKMALINKQPSRNIQTFQTLADFLLFAKGNLI